MIIEIGKTLISSEIIDEQFVCDLDACKGICCVEGDSGAPLEDSELSILEDVYPVVKKYLSPEGITEIEKQGVFVIDIDGDKVTPTINNLECAFFYRKEGTTFCAIEQAYLNGEIDFKKPISCHLYPIRINKYAKFDGVNYDEQPMCNAACTLGKKLKVPVFKFLKEPLIRKYGDDWYADLESVVNLYLTEKDNKNQ